MKLERAIEVNAIGNASVDETLEEKAEREWKSDPKVREEFTSKETYLGWLKAEASGRVRILKPAQ